MNETELNRRDKLLWVSAKLFLSKGYSATSVDEIAEAAGTSGPALYRSFESKQDILDKVCLAGMKVRMKGIQAAIAQGHGKPIDTLRELVRNRIDFALGPWAYQVPITLAEYKHLSPAAAKKIDTASEIGTAEWFRCLAQLCPDTPTRELLATIYSVLMQITYVSLHLDDLELSSDVRPMLERIALASLTGPD